MNEMNTRIPPLDESQSDVLGMDSGPREGMVTEAQRATLV
jgi:hypothetical protein